ncbi:MAG: dockerin type I repeat-containing protein [Ruminococcus sp.]
MKIRKALIAISALLLSVSMLGGTVQAADNTVLVATSVTQQTICSDTCGDLYISEIYGTVDGGATWEFDCNSCTLVFDNGTINSSPYTQVPSDVWYCTKSIVWGKNFIPKETTGSLDSVTYNLFVHNVVFANPDYMDKTMYCYADSAFAKEYEVITGNPDVFGGFLGKQGEPLEVSDVIYLNETDDLPYTPVDKTQSGGYVHFDQTSGSLDNGVDWTFDCSNRILTFDNGTFDNDVLSAVPDTIQYCTYSIVWGKNLKLIENDENDSISSTFNCNNEAFYLLYEWNIGKNKEMYCYADSAFFEAYEGVLNSDVVEEADLEIHEVKILNETVLYGDTNLDGRIDITDAVLLNKAASNSVKLNPSQLTNADCNGDGSISVDDSLALLRYLVHLEAALPTA